VDPIYFPASQKLLLQSIIIMPQELRTSSWHKWELALKPNVRHFKQRLPEYCNNLQLLQSCSILWQEFRVGETLQAVVFCFVGFFLRSLLSFFSLKNLIIKPLPHLLLYQLSGKRLI